MFDNVSQGLFTIGATGYLIVVPVLRLSAVFLMIVSTYKLLKARQDPHKFLWIVAICCAPLIARIVFEVYHRRISPKEIVTAKGSTPFLIASVTAFVFSVLLTVVSIVSMGVGYIKSEIDGEPLASFYDVHGNEYDDLYDVPLYDEAGNRYTHKSAWFTTGTYIDQNGKSYDGDRCYLSEEGYFYFDENKQLEPYRDFYYYTDGDQVYYSLIHRVYWEDDGTIYEMSGKLHLELFDFDE